MVPAMTVTRRSAMAALGLLSLPAVAAANCGCPADLHDGWKTAAPTAEGLDAKLICAIGPRLAKMTAADANGVVVARHGVLVYEHYFGVNPLTWNATTVHALNSITKSVVAILTGIAFDRGWLKSLDAPVLSFFPKDAALRTLGKDRITLRDLLTMTSGLAWPEHAVPYTDPSNIVRQMARASDPYRFVLQQPLAATPGTVWNYNSGGVELLGAVLQKVAGRPLDQFAKEALFDLLGIKDWAWARLSGEANGNPAASFGLWLRPRGLAKIGQLVLNHGARQGRQIVSAAWVNAMTTRQIPGWTISLFGKMYSYGYLWWLGRSPADNHGIDWVGGLGFGGQRLFVVPSLDLVVAVTAGLRRRRPLGYVAGDTALAMTARAAIAH